jgi:chemotaxis protein methyltransferase CheR
MDSDLSDTDSFLKLIARVSKLVADKTGNILGDKQRSMVENRIKGRMLELKIKDPIEYIAYIDSNQESETDFLIGLLTTHHTFFFREFIHFEFLKKQLPSIVTSVKERGSNTLKIYSAACSKGQEVYSLSMFMDYHLPQVDKSMNYEILGTDVDPKSVRFAENGVYNRNEIKEVPMIYLNNHWAKGTGPIADFVKAKDSIKKQCSFAVGNLLEVGPNSPPGKFDIIFCRNVFIYFNPKDINTISVALQEKLFPTGFLISGVSESLSQTDLSLKQYGPSIYGPQTVEESAPEAVAPVVASKIRVLCVDDSPSILKLLERIFKDDDFEVVGTCKNGVEAAEFAKNNEFDVMTLDIHMPEMDGVTYLEKHFNSNHPPVIMVSSANRDDSSLANKALSLGAVDFVEKPELNNMAERAEEIKNKIKVAVANKLQSSGVSDIDLEFKQTLHYTDENCLRVIIASQDEKSNVDFVLAQNAVGNPQTFHYSEEELQDNLSKIKADASSKALVILTIGALSDDTIISLSSIESAYLVCEDSPHLTPVMKEKASDIFPLTSYAYMADLFFHKKENNKR